MVPHDPCPLTTIIVVNYNGRRYLQDCFGSVLSLDHPLDRLEIVMVDNGSSDGSVEYVTAEFPQVKIIHCGINNYCRANNMGIRAARGNFIALLNNDVKVRRDWLTHLLAVMLIDPAIGAVTGKICFPDGRIQSTGHVELPDMYWRDRGFGENDNGQYDRQEDINSLSHCAVLYSKACLSSIGLLDEEFNMYLDDVDMSLRARAKGYRLTYIPASIAYHHFHGSIDSATVHQFCERNRLLLIAKHFPEKLADSLYGTGYFTLMNSRGDLIPMLIPALQALISKHPPDKVAGLIPKVGESLQKIMAAERAFINDQRESERAQSAQKDNVIVEITEKASKLSDSVIQKDRDIAEKIRELAGRERELAELSVVLSQEKSVNAALNESVDRAHRDNKHMAESLACEEATNARISKSLADLKLVLQQTDRELVTKVGILRNSELNVQRLTNEIDAFYASRTFRYIVGPMWIVLDFFKNVKKSIFQQRGRAVTTKLCIGYFVADARCAQPMRRNGYCIKVTNDENFAHTISIKFSIGDRAETYARFSRDCTIEPYSSRELVFSFDWHKDVVFHDEDGDVIASAQIDRLFVAPSMYRLCAELRADGTSQCLDQLILYQKFIL